MSNNIFKILKIIFLTALLAGCSMGGGETGTGFKDQTTVGVITGFGSVFVNGVEYMTDDSTKVLVEGETSQESFLKVGMLVTLEGGVDAGNIYGIANSIHFERDIQGEVIENLYTTNKTLNVLGQTVFIDNETIFESQVASITGFELIAPKNIVEVSGFSDGGGQIFATRVDVKMEAYSVGSVMEIKGEIKNLSANIFTLGNFTVDYSDVTYTNMQAADLAEGLLVKVKSQMGIQNGNVLKASEIILKETRIVKNVVKVGEGVELEGVVTSIIDATTFLINGQKVLINSSTQLENISISSIKVGDRITLEGNLDAEGNIVAKEFKGKKQSSTQTEGLITKLDVSKSSITVNGVEIIITNTTRVKDDASESDEQERRYFNFNNMRVGDKVQVSFYTESSNGTIIATKLEREKKEINDGAGDDEPGGTSNDSENNDGGSSDGKNEQDEWETKGVVSQLDAEKLTFVVDDISINYSRATVSSTLTNNVEVEIQGIIESGVWYATEIEVKDED